MAAWCHVKCCRFGASSVHTIQPCTKLQCHFIQSHIGRVYVCLAVTCHLHVWQNDRDLLRATAVDRDREKDRDRVRETEETERVKLSNLVEVALQLNIIMKLIRDQYFWDKCQLYYNYS